MRPHKLPAIVYLRTSPTLPVGEVYGALGVTRGHAYQLRQRNGFPASVGGMVQTAQLAAWLTHPARGVRISWV